MSNENLGQEPAYPTSAQFEGGSFYQAGMSTRLVIAKDVLCALLIHKGAYYQSLSQGDLMENLGGYTPDYVVELAYQFTDELLKQEENNKSEQKNESEGFSEEQGW